MLGTRSKRARAAGAAIALSCMSITGMGALSAGAAPVSAQVPAPPGFDAVVGSGAVGGSEVAGLAELEPQTGIAAEPGFLAPGQAAAARVATDGSADTVEFTATGGLARTGLNDLLFLAGLGVFAAGCATVLGSVHAAMARTRRLAAEAAVQAAARANMARRPPRR